MGQDKDLERRCAEAWTALQRAVSPGHQDISLPHTTTVAVQWQRFPMPDLKEPPPSSQRLGPSGSIVTAVLSSTWQSWPTGRLTEERLVTVKMTGWPTWPLT